MDKEFESTEEHIYDMPQEIKSERRYVSELFISLTVSSLVSYILTILISVVLSHAIPSYSPTSFLSLLTNDLYTVFAIFLFVIMTSKKPSLGPVPIMEMNTKRFFSYLVASLSLMIAGSFIGNTVSAFVGAITDREQTNVVGEIVTMYPKWQIALVVMVIAPITEEFLFRKLLIDKTVKYGTGFSVLLSGILFGAFHGNFFQFFYGAMIGCLLAYVYCIHGKLLYCILIHAFVNFAGSVAPLYCMDFLASSSEFLNFIATAYNVLYVLSIPAGLMVLILRFRESIALFSPGTLVSPAQTLKKNIGLIIYIIYTLIIFSISTI